MNPDWLWGRRKRAKEDASPFVELKSSSLTTPTYAMGGYVSNSANSYAAEIARILNQQMLYGYAAPKPTAAEANPKFSGKEFAVSTAKGARSFKIDSLGRLTGIHYPQVWLPGENVSECRANETHPEGKFPECACGFYGYYDGSNDYYTSGLVSAVVEGYGEAVLGSQGFRVTKAKILALSIDSTVKSKTAYLVRRNYADVPMFDSFTQLISEFPTDYGLGTPSVDEPDFWTRDAS